MNCPYCGHNDTRVVNSRPSPQGDTIRRRRECQSCTRRFTTVEYVEMVATQVVKRNGTREPFELAKVRKGIERACEKRPVSPAQVDGMVRDIEREILQRDDREVPTEEVGKLILRKLKESDHVAYLRFASVYKQFHDLQDFNAEIQTLLKD